MTSVGAPLESGDEEARAIHSDWSLTIMAGLLIGGAVVLATTVQLMTGRGSPVHLPMRTLHLIGVVVALAVLWMRRKSPSRALCSGAFASMVLSYVVLLWGEQAGLAEAGRRGVPWEPFVPHKLLMFFIAALCPRPWWVGVALFIALVAHAATLWGALNLGAPGAGVPDVEPIASLIFALVAVTLFALRVVHARQQRTLARARAEADLLRTINETFVAVQDSANTPLQNLTLAIALMKERHDQVEPLLESAERALERLRDLGKLLAVKEVTSASIDPAALERLRALAGVKPSRPQ